MTTGQIRWTPKPDGSGVGTMLDLTCTPDGRIHMETPDGGFSGDYSNALEAQSDFMTLFEHGITQAKEGSGGSPS